MNATDAAAVGARLRERLLDVRNPDGGWAYVPGKRSRIEPTSWALLALSPPDGLPGGSAVFGRWARDGSRYIDGPSLPPNNVHNALAALMLLQDGATGERLARSVVDALVASRGITASRSEIVIQDNSLEGWGWVDGTTSWLEPTAWNLLLLKQLRRRAGGNAKQAERIAIADRLILDRACRDGGWNYGNAIVYGKELWPYAWTTALALVALQDRRDHPIVRQALYRVGRDAQREGSPVALGLATVCLRIYGSAVDEMQQQVANVVSADHAHASEDILSLALALCALDGSRTLAALTI